MRRKRKLFTCVLAAFFAINLIPFPVNAEITASDYNDEAARQNELDLITERAMSTLKDADNKSSDILSIAVNSNDHKKDYLKGEELDVTDLTILVNYTDGTSETVPVTKDMVMGFDSSEHRLNQKLAVTYKEHECYYYVHIMNWVVRVYKMGLDGTYPDAYEVYRCGVASNGWSMRTTYGTGSYAVEGFTRDENLSVVSGKIDKNNPHAILKIYLARNHYKLVFNDEDGTVYSETTVSYGAPILVPEDKPEKNGFKFIGWGEVAATMPAEDTTYTAIWENADDTKPEDPDEGSGDEAGNKVSEKPEKASDTGDKMNVLLPTALMITMLITMAAAGVIRRKQG